MNLRMKGCPICGKEYQPTGHNQKYCAECGPTIFAEITAKWHMKNPKKVRAAVAKWDKANIEKCRAKSLKWSKEHPERIKENHSRWREKNPEYRAKWQKENPEKVAAMNNKRHAAKYANTSFDEMLTSTKWIEILKTDNGHCHYCGKEAKLTLEHVVPLSRGGKHSKDNIVAACRRCNSKKGVKTEEEWMDTIKEGGEIFNRNKT